jgi:hypothetical protein
VVIIFGWFRVGLFRFMPVAQKRGMEQERKPIAITHPKIAAQWHPTKNGILTPFDVLGGSHKKVWWKCLDGPDDHEWETTISHRTRGGKCPCCSGQKIVSSNCLATTHPELSLEWHPTKNRNLSPFNVVAGSHRKVWWRCQTGVSDHDFQASIANRIYGRVHGTNCPYCVGKKVASSNCLETLYPEISKEWDYTKNGSATPGSVTTGSMKKYWWKCAIGHDDHEWKAAVAKRVAGRNCPCCAGKKVVPSNCLATVFPILAKEWHPTKNGHLTPDNIVAGSHSKVWWLCHCGHEWQAVVKSRAAGRGCPACKASHGEKAVVTYCEHNRLSFDREVKFKTCKSRRCLRFDFVVTYSGKLFAIEYHGLQHFIPVSFGSGSSDPVKNLKDIQYRDQIKRAWCADPENGITLIELSCKPDEVADELAKVFC